MVVIAFIAGVVAGVLFCLVAADKRMHSGEEKT